MGTLYILENLRMLRFLTGDTNNKKKPNLKDKPVKELSPTKKALSSQPVVDLTVYRNCE